MYLKPSFQNMFKLDLIDNACFELMYDWVNGKMPFQNIKLQSCMTIILLLSSANRLTLFKHRIHVFI